MAVTSSWRRSLSIVAAVATVAAYVVLVNALNNTTTAPMAVATTTTTAPVTPSIVEAVAVNPGPLHAPHFGTYPIESSINGQKQVGTLVVGKDGTQRQTIGPAVTVIQLAWTTHGQLVHTGEATGDNSCTWKPAATVIAKDLREGRHWSSDVSCTVTRGATVVTIRRQETAKVVRKARSLLQGGSIDSWLIERRIVQTERASGRTFVGEEASTELFAPLIGLPVYKLSRIEWPRPDGTLEKFRVATVLLNGVPT